MLVAVGAHDVVGLAAVGRGDGVEARELHRAETLEHAPRLVLRAQVALDGDEPAGLRVEDARALVGSPDACPAVVEAQT